MLSTLKSRYMPRMAGPDRVSRRTEDSAAVPQAYVVTRHRPQAICEPWVLAAAALIGLHKPGSVASSGRNNLIFSHSPKGVPGRPERII
jgi:hypothetical protein